MSINVDYVFPKKAENILKASAGFIKTNSANVEVYENATVLPAVQFNDYDVSHGRGGVIDSKGNYIESSKTKARIQGKYDPDEYEIVDQKVVFCGFFNKAWGHYITEGVSRLWYALKNDETVDSYVFIEEKDGNKTFNGNYLAFLKLLGIDKKVKLINKPTRFSSVLIPEEGFVYNEYYTDEFVKMYQHINAKGLAQYTGPVYEKVFFSKRKCEISLISNLNEKFVDKFFEKNGFKIFYPERLSLVDTIGILQNAKIFCGLSSSLTHNQLFGHANQTLLSIEKQAFYTPYQIFVANITGCECVFIDAYRGIFTVNSAGPFIFDYTDHLHRYVVDHHMIPGKPMSEYKFRKIFKKYLAYYFNFNMELPPDYMYRQYIIDMTRETYNDTVKNKKVFQLSFYNRVALKLKRLWLKYFG